IGPGLLGLLGPVPFLAANFQAEDTGPGAGDRQPSPRRVAKPSRARLPAALDEFDGPVHALLGNVTADVFGGPQGQQLAAGAADIAAPVVIADLVAPAAVVGVVGLALRLEDDVDRLDELGANFLGQLLVTGHAGHLGEHERADAMVIHLVLAHGAEQPV